MTSCFGLFSILLIVNVILVNRADALGDRNGTSAIGSLLRRAYNYIQESLKYLTKELPHTIENSNVSIRYLLYTPDQPMTPCYLETDLAGLDRCPFNTSLPLKILVYGFTIMIQPGGAFMMIKNEMLKFYQYNVIIVDWSTANQPPYFQAAVNTVFVGQALADFIQFLEKSAAIDPKQIHLIGHSLGAHLSGVAGGKIPNLGRITGLDPADRFFYPITVLHRLSYTDANFVDVIHSSNRTEGYGESKPMGDQDFYVNGAYTQPQCQYIRNDYPFSPRDSCNHDAAVSYFLQSIAPGKCEFLGTKCDSYSNFLNGLCSGDSSPMAEMGLPAKPIPGLPPNSKFYLITSPNEPYCLQDGYEPPSTM